jgi:hypothetical protein
MTPTWHYSCGKQYGEESIPSAEKELRYSSDSNSPHLELQLVLQQTTTWRPLPHDYANKQCGVESFLPEGKVKTRPPIYLRCTHLILSFNSSGSLMLLDGIKTGTYDTLA